jgi:Cu+-exporting ATPase
MSESTKDETSSPQDETPLGTAQNPGPPTQTVHDPVCHMDIVITSAAGRSDYEGHTYYFCSPGCKRDFDADPAAALKAEAEYDHSQPSEMMMSMGEEASAGRRRPWWRFWGG